MKNRFSAETRKRYIDNSPRESYWYIGLLTHTEPRHTNKMGGLYIKKNKEKRRAEGEQTSDWVIGCAVFYIYSVLLLLWWTPHREMTHARPDYIQPILSCFVSCPRVKQVEAFLGAILPTAYEINGGKNNNNNNIVYIDGWMATSTANDENLKRREEEAKKINKQQQVISTKRWY